MRRYSFLSLASILLISSAFASLSKIKQTHVCYVASPVDHILPRANDLPSAMAGFEMSIQNNPHLRFSQYQFKKHSEMKDAIDWANKENCDVIVGLITSQDAILAAPGVELNQIFSLSSTATTDALKQWSKSSRSLSVSASKYVQALRKTIGDQKIVVVGSPGSIFSSGFKTAVEASFTHHQYVDTPDDKAKALIKEAQAVLFANYPLEGLSWMNLPELQNKMLVGNSSWSETHVFLNVSSDLKSWQDVKILNPFNEEIGRKTPFARAYLKKYHRWPDHDSYYDYDAISMIGNCARQENKQAFYECLRGDLKFQGVTGQYHFKKNESHPERKMELVTLKKLLGRSL